MSILSALKTQHNSIDDLAKLPQAMIMQMAQKGEIRQDMLAPILARKAELAQAVANTKALQQGGAQAPSTVMEQIMSRNAVAEAPESGRDIGLAQLPVRDDMYDPQRMAGGGIVAFANNMDQPVSEDMPANLTEEERRYLEMNPYMARSRAVADLGRGVKEAFTDPRNYNPVNLYQRYVGQPFAEAVGKFTNETPEQQAERFRMATKARTGEIPMFAGTDLTTKGKMVAEGRMKPTDNVIDVMQRERQQAQSNKELADFDKATALFEQEQAAKKNVAKSGNVSTKPPVVKTPTPEVKEEEPLYAKYEKMLMDEREAAKGAREEAKWSRMLEAGLGVLGGESPYAMVNIGKGATPGLKGYGEDVKALRGEERARVKDLLGIEGMRQEAKRSAQDVELKKQMIDVQRMAASKPDSTSQIIGLGKKAGLNDRDIMSLLVGSKDPNVSAQTIAMKAFYDSPVLQAQYKNDVNAFLRAQGIGAGAGGQTVLNYVPGQGLK